MNDEIFKLIERKDEILMTVEVGKKGVPELQKIKSNYDYYVLIEDKPSKFRWINAYTGNHPGLSGKTAIAAITEMMMSGFEISYASEGNLCFME